MMDLVMLTVLAVCVGFVGLLVRWCQNQVDANE